MASLQANASKCSLVGSSCRPSYASLQKSLGMSTASRSLASRKVPAMSASEGSRPGGRVRSPSPSSPANRLNVSSTPITPDMERPTNGAGGRLSSPAPSNDFSGTNGSADYLNSQRPSGGSRQGIREGGSGNLGGNGDSSSGGSGGSNNFNGNGGKASGGGGDFLRPLFTWGLLYAFLASIAWLGSKACKRTSPAPTESCCSKKSAA